MNEKMCKTFSFLEFHKMKKFYREIEKLVLLGKFSFRAKMLNTEFTRIQRILQHKYFFGKEISLEIFYLCHVIYSHYLFPLYSSNLSFSKILLRLLHRSWSKFLAVFPLVFTLHPALTYTFKHIKDAAGSYNCFHFKQYLFLC